MSHQHHADLLIRSNNVVAAGIGLGAPAYVASIGDEIVDCSLGNGSEWVGSTTRVIEAGEGTVCAGLHDNHVFITGTVPDFLAVDLAGVMDPLQAVQLLADAGGRRSGHTPVIGTNWGGEPAGFISSSVAAAGGLDHPGHGPVIVWDSERTLVWQNGAAHTRYRLPAGPVTNEALAGIFRDAFEDPSLVWRVYSTAQEELFRRGVVSVKDIAFDDHLGALPVLRAMRDDGSLKLRIAFASQPVTAPVDIEFGRQAIAEYRDSRLRFQGFKLMVDGVWIDGSADLLDLSRASLEDDPFRPEYDAIAADVRSIVEAGLPFGLNVDGDGAARWALNLFERLHGEGVNLGPRYSLSDVSCIDPHDALRAGKLGLTAEVYTQFLNLFPSEKDFPADCLPGEHLANLNRFATMQRAGVNIASGTDLPLFWPSLPDAIRSATFRRFADGSPSGGWHCDEALTTLEVVESWTAGGARAVGNDRGFGRLARGYRADVAVFSHDLFTSTYDELADAHVVATIAAGDLVHWA